jgi:hypothetical protein
MGRVCALRLAPRGRTTGASRASRRFADILLAIVNVAGKMNGPRSSFALTGLLERNA